MRRRTGMSRRSEEHGGEGPSSSYLLVFLLRGVGDGASPLLTFIAHPIGVAVLSYDQVSPPGM